MPNPLDYTELEKAAEAIVGELAHKTYLTADDIEVIRKLAVTAFASIAKRAFKQAAIAEGRIKLGQYGDDESRIFPRLTIGYPSVLLSDACAALYAPKETPKETP